MTTRRAGCLTSSASTIPFDGLTWGFNGPESADNQDSSSSFVTTSGILPPDEFPQFLSWPSSRWDKPGGPFAPHTGDQYVYSQIADVTYKRLTRDDRRAGRRRQPDVLDVVRHRGRLGLPGGGGAFGQRRHWTTLPEATGHTSTSTGQSCPAGWFELHPFLEHYQTLNDGQPPTCSPTGTSGEWNAASGNSNGWEQWSINLDEYAGQTVEISIAYVSDWATQGLGVFIDDVTLPDGTSTSFETGLDGWTVSGPPEGSGANANNFEVTDAGGFPVGASITHAGLDPDGLRVRGHLDRGRSATRSWAASWRTCSADDRRAGGRRGAGPPRSRVTPG